MSVLINEHLSYPFLAQAAAHATVEAAGARQVAARLSALESALPLAALKTGDWAPWAAWRRSLSHAETAAGLMPLVGFEFCWVMTEAFFAL